MKYRAYNKVYYGQRKYDSTDILTEADKSIICTNTGNAKQGYSAAVIETFTDL